MKIFRTLSKRGLALFLVLTMCVSLLPATALAAEAAEALHTHNEDGWACVEESQLICGYEQEHTHDETCWTASEASEEPVCGLAESEGHLHGEACYTGETVQVCDLEVSEEHEHGEACFVTETVLSCGQEEAEGHAHGEDCFAAGEAVLTCELEEHQHGEACYASVWTCTEPSEDVSRFLQAVKEIPEEITAENVEEAEVKIAEAIEAYQHLGGAEKSNASVVRAYDVILAAEIAVEAAKNGAPEETPETVLPEDAVVIDPAVLVEYTGVEEEEVAVADLFTFVANTYLVDEEDPDVVTLPASLYFVGENVEERFDLMDILFPAESEDELPEEPETVALTADSIVYQDVPVTAYFLPEETVAQEELLMEMDDDGQMFADGETINLAIGEPRELTNSTSNYRYTQWIVSVGEKCVSLTPAGNSATVIGNAVGTATVKYQGRSNQYSNWTDIAVYAVTVADAYAVFCYTLVPGKSESSGGSADSIWNGMGVGSVTGVAAPGTGKIGNHVTYTNSNFSFPETFPDIEVDGRTYHYASAGSSQADEAGYYTIQWNSYLLVADGANAGSNKYNPVVNCGNNTFHLDGQITLNQTNYHTVSFMVREPGANRFDPYMPEQYTKRVATGTSEQSLNRPSPNNTFYENLNYHFDGWYMDEACTQKAEFTGTISRNTFYYGKYMPEETYTVTYAPGTQGTFTAQKTSGLRAGSETPKFDGEPAGNKGYSFAGWEPEVAGTVTGDAMYVAQWTAAEAQIVFDANGGTDAPEGITGTTGAHITNGFPSTKPVREGYTFTGWYTEAEPNSGTEVTAYPATFPAGTTTYYAHWNLRNDLSYTVQYLDQDEKEISTSETVFDVAYGSTVTLKDVEACKLIKDIPGYSFERFEPEDGLKIGASSEGNVLKLYYKVYTYEVTAEIDNGGTITGAGTYDHGSNATVSWTPAANYHVVSVTVDGEPWTGTGTSVTFKDISGNHSVVVETTINTYTYTVNYHYDEAIVAENGEAEFGSEIPYSTTSPITYEGHNYVLDDVVVTSATVTADVADNVVDVYYNLDEKGSDGEKPDGTPDKYQVEVTFVVRNGYWSDLQDGAKFSTPQKLWLTKYKDGKPAVDGTATVTADSAPAVGRLPYDGYSVDSGTWTPSLPMDITEAQTFTYAYLPGSYAYTVNYYYDNVLAPSQTVNGTGTFGARIPYDASTPKTYAGQNYMLERIDGIGKKITANSAENVVNIYYTLDAIGPDGGPDGIADKYQARVTFVVENGTWTGGTTSQSAVVTLMKDGVPAAAADGGVYQITDGDVPNGTPNAGYLNTGAWRDGRNPANAIINGDTKFTFTYALIPVIPPVTPPGGGGGGGGGTTIPDGPTPLVPDPGTTIADQDVPLAAPGLNNTDHFDYIKGYVIDGQILVRPEANITRAEVATIFFRLMTKEFREANWATENDFTDVKKGDWYNNAISTCTRAGILKGYEDGTFKPNQTISREEFAAIAARFASEEVPAGGMFKDIAGRWSEKDIERAAAMGWIKGSNGLFRPVDKITRAEVIVIVNRMLDRVPDADHMLPDMKTFADNTPDMWWYADVQEATNSHEYDRAEDGVTGIWTSLLPEQDWAALEEEWATAADANVADVAPKLGAEGEKPEEGAKEPETAGGSDGNGEE